MDTNLIDEMTQKILDRITAVQKEKNITEFKKLSLANQIEVIYFALDKQKEEQKKEKTGSAKEPAV